MSQSQHLDALKLANVVRLRTAQLKRSVSDLPAGDGARRAADILRFELDTASLRVDELLLSVRRYGARRVGGLFAEAGIDYAARRRRVSDLTDRQRLLIADLLDDAADASAAGRTA